MSTNGAHMNILPNPYRNIPFEESETDHTFKVYRHFPELRKSVETIAIFHNEKETTNRIDRENRKSTHLNKRDITLKSTHILDELSKSCLADIHTLHDFRKVLFSNKLKKAPHVVETNDETLDPSTENHNYLNEGIGNGYITALRAANDKLTKRSLSHDSRDPISYLLGFEGLKLDKYDFNVQIRRCLNINLTRDELEALFFSMDVDTSGFVDGVEFVRYFFMLGNKARHQITIDAARRKVQCVVDEKLDAELQLAKEREWQSEQVSRCTVEEEDSAMAKLAHAALRCDPSSFINKIKLRGFEKYLTPFEFKHQIEKSFDMHLTPGECGALMTKFGSTGLPIAGVKPSFSFSASASQAHSIDGRLFLCRFFVFQQETWKTHKTDTQIYAQRREKVLSMGQNLDYLPKTLGR